MFLAATRSPGHVKHITSCSPFRTRTISTVPWIQLRCSKAEPQRSLKFLGHNVASAEKEKKCGRVLKNPESRNPTVGSDLKAKGRFARVEKVSSAAEVFQSKIPATCAIQETQKERNEMSRGFAPRGFARTQKNYFRHMIFQAKNEQNSLK